jgi:hypothetical protein
MARIDRRAQTQKAASVPPKSAEKDRTTVVKLTEKAPLAQLTSTLSTYLDGGYTMAADVAIRLNPPKSSQSGKTLSEPVELLRRGITLHSLLSELRVYVRDGYRIDGEATITLTEPKPKEAPKKVYWGLGALGLLLTTQQDTSYGDSFA